MPSGLHWPRGTNAYYTPKLKKNPVTIAVIQRIILVCPPTEEALTTTSHLVVVDAIPGLACPPHLYVDNGTG